VKKLRDKIKKKYYHLRKSLSPTEKPNRLIIEKAKWLNNADSPVMLMIDDLSNAWHSRNGNETWDIGGDWGGGLSKKNSAFSFLNEHLLHDFPEVKVTFFAVAGRISQYTYGQSFSFSEPLNYSEESKKFFMKLSENKKFEMAYHGYNHGNCAEKIENYIQEWKRFKSIDEACDQIEKGKEIFKDVFGRYPRGGKYGGWEYNEFADESIDRSGFLWWCRDWMPRDIHNKIGDAYYEPQFFGENLVVALPSTIHGFLWDKKQINKLLEKRQIISIEEHIASVRPDGMIQTPNIIDDINKLKSLFSYIRTKNVWHATGTEIAEYFIAFSFTTIYDIKKDSFKIKYTGRVSSPILTVIIDTSFISSNGKKRIRITLPDGNELSNWFIHRKKDNCFLVNIPVQNGTYNIST
jgi:hypothetical protein